MRARTSGGEETRVSVEGKCLMDGGSKWLRQSEGPIHAGSERLYSREGQRHAGLAQREKWISRGGDVAEI